MHDVTTDFRVHGVDEKPAMKSEERRALILLGITAVLASLLAAMWAAIWTNTRKMEDFYWNFPPGCESPCPHLTVYVIPIFQDLVIFWVIYAFFIFWYFSEDWLSGKKGTWFRNLSHGLAIFALGAYVLLIVWE